MRYTRISEIPFMALHASCWRGVTIVLSGPHAWLSQAAIRPPQRVQTRMACKPLEAEGATKAHNGRGVGLKAILRSFARPWGSRTRTPTRGHLLGSLARCTGPARLSSASTAPSARLTYGAYCGRQRRRVSTANGWSMTVGAKHFRIAVRAYPRVGLVVLLPIYRYFRLRFYAELAEEGARRITLDG